MIEILYVMVGVLAIGWLVALVCILELWTRVERLANPYRKSRATIIPPRVPMPAKGKR